MKCQHCGNNLNIEDKFCPYCGQPNPFAVKHQEEMERFEKDYKKTKKDVLEKSSRFNRHTVRITIIAVLVALIALMCFLLAKADDIRWWRQERSVEADAQAHREAIQQLMDDRDYQGLCSYFDRYGLAYNDAMREFDGVFQTTSSYRLFYNDLMILQVVKADKESFDGYYNENETIESIANSIHLLYEYMKPIDDDQKAKAYQGDKMEYMEDLRECMEILTAGYFGMTLEEAESMRSMSTSKISVLLEDCYEEQK